MSELEYDRYTTCLHCHQARVLCDRKEGIRSICSHCEQMGNHQCHSRESMVFQHIEQQRQLEQELHQLQLELDLRAQQLREQLHQLSYYSQRDTRAELQWHEMHRQFLNMQRQEMQLRHQLETPAQREARQQQEQQEVELMLQQLQLN